jgi:hypothetical protein
MRTTTVEALTSAIVERIRQITPSSTRNRSHPWRPVPDRDQVSSGELRVFCVEIVDVRPYPSGIYSPSEIEHEATALVYTSYGATPRVEARGLLADDGRQVWLTIDVLRDAETVNTIAGLVAFDHAGWQVEDDEQGRQWGAHTFAVRVLLSGIPGAT